MARCDACGTMILFGGESWNGMRFCSENCRQTAVTASYAEDIPPDIVLQHAMTLRNRHCPLCGGEGPNDFHGAWSVISLLIVSFHSKQEIFGCGRCGTMHKVKYLLITGLFGWWGIPWGILLTPFLEVANLIGLFRGVPIGPSEELKQLALAQLSEELRRRVEDDDEESAAVQTG